MKEQSKLSTSKVARATQFATTGAKVGVNYIRHYAKKTIDPSRSRTLLHEDNAADIYEGLSKLKGGALKVLQMMSMDEQVLPAAYSERFALSQYSVPPLSYPLVVKTFRDAFGMAPTEKFETFSRQAIAAASIGQVHKATIGDKTFAVKVQYPGVGDSIKSDLRIVRPFAIRLFNISATDVDYFMVEIEEKLLEETNYSLELTRSEEIARACHHLPSLVFPSYYPEYSSNKILSMDWLEGKHLDQFLADNISQKIRNQIGQALWDFYDFQVHTLHRVHADPHPGNFLFQVDTSNNGRVGVIDFGCVKEIDEDFYKRYFTLLRKDFLEDESNRDRLFEELHIIRDVDSLVERQLFTQIFEEGIRLLSRPFAASEFDFGDDAYFAAVFEYGDRISRMPEVRQSKVARGPRDALYINRTYFGLYSLLNKLRATVKTNRPNWLG